MGELEWEVLLLDGLSNESVHFRRIEACGRLVDQLAIASHNHLRVVTLDLNDVLKQLTHLREMSPIVLLHLELASLCVQEHNSELVGFGEARALPLDLVRSRHDLCCAFVEDH